MDQESNKREVSPASLGHLLTAVLHRALRTGMLCKRQRHVCAKPFERLQPFRYRRAKYSRYQGFDAKVRVSCRLGSLLARRYAS